MGRKAGLKTMAPENALVSDESQPLRSPIGCVSHVIGELSGWMERKVKGFTRFNKDDHRGYANDLWRYLETGSCPCGGGDRCCKQHRQKAFDPLALDRCFQFIRRAVIGPMGLLAQSIEQGMFYRLVLKDLGILVVRVGLKVCADRDCGRRYEGAECPGCCAPFDPSTTPVIGEKRLVIRGLYSEEEWWKCGNKPEKGSARLEQKKPKWRDTGEETERNYWKVHPLLGEHYYQQSACRGGKHGTHCDCCPLSACPLLEAERPKGHGQRPTSLFTDRGAQVPRKDGQDPSTAFRREAVAAGLRRALEAMTNPQRREFKELFQKAHNGTELKDLLDEVVTWLFDSGTQHLESALLDPVRATVRRTLEERGLGFDPSED